MGLGNSLRDLQVAWGTVGDEGWNVELACDFSNSVMILLGCSLARVTKLPISVALVYIRNRRSPSVKLVAARRELKTAPAASRSLIT